MAFIIITIPKWAIKSILEFFDRCNVKKQKEPRPTGTRIYTCYPPNVQIRTYSGI